MKPIIRIFTILILVLLYSCKKDYYEPPTAKPENVSFSKAVIPILNSSCTSCHHTGGQNPDLSEQNAYSNLTTNNEFVVPGEPENSELYNRIMGQGSMMPPGGMMSDNNINIIYAWIKEGALNN